MAFKDGDRLILNILSDLGDKYLVQKEFIQLVADDPGTPSHLRDKADIILQNKIV